MGSYLKRLNTREYKQSTWINELQLPGFHIAARVLRVPPLPWLLEIGYRGFLVIRPRLQSRARGGRSLTPAGRTPPPR